jgi:hypothetical protein
MKQLTTQTLHFERATKNSVLYVNPDGFKTPVANIYLAKTVFNGEQFPDRIMVTVEVDG